MSNLVQNSIPRAVHTAGAIKFLFSSQNGVVVPSSVWTTGSKTAAESGNGDIYVFGNGEYVRTNSSFILVIFNKYSEADMSAQTVDKIDELKKLQPHLNYIRVRKFNDQLSTRDDLLKKVDEIEF